MGVAVIVYGVGLGADIAFGGEDAVPAGGDVIAIIGPLEANCMVGAIGEIVIAEGIID